MNNPDVKKPTATYIDDQSTQTIKSRETASVPHLTTRLTPRMQVADNQKTASSGRLDDLERVIANGMRGFIEVGFALLEVRDSKLYMKQYGSFEEYCRERWGWGKSYAHMLIKAAQVIQTLPPELSTIVDNEAKARELIKVPEQNRPQVIRAVMKASGPITARMIRDAAQPTDIEGEVSCTESQTLDPEAARRTTGKKAKTPKTSKNSLTRSPNNRSSANNGGRTHDLQFAAKGEAKRSAETDRNDELENLCATTIPREDDKPITATEANAAINELIAWAMLRVREVGSIGLSSDTKRRLREEATRLKATPSLGGYPLARMLWSALIQIGRAFPDASSSKVIPTFQLEDV